MWLVDLLRHLTADLSTGRVSQARKLRQMLIHLMAGSGALARRANEQGALNRRSQSDRITSDGTPRLLTERLEGVKATGFVESAGERAHE
jgi:hypothetical protein